MMAIYEMERDTMDPWQTMSEGVHLIKGKLFKYSMLLFLSGLASSFLNTIVSTEQMMEQPQWIIPYLIVAMLLITIRNTIYIVFIKKIRNEVFQKEDVVYSFHKLPLHVMSAILFELLQLGLSYVLVVLGSFMPILVMPAAILIQGAIIGVSLFIAFAIYDGAQSAMMVVNGSFRLLWKNFRLLVIMAMPLVIWLLVYQLLNNMIVVLLVDQTTQISWDVLSEAFATAASRNYVYGYVLIELANVFIGSIIECILFSAYAIVYEKECMQFYNFAMKIEVDVINVEEAQSDDAPSQEEKS